MPDNKMHWKDFFMGTFLGAVCMSLILLLYLPNIVSGQGTVNAGNATASSDSNSSSDNSSGMKSYNTDIYEWELSLVDGIAVKFYTPSDFYSLTDQYVETLEKYYNIDTDDTNLICVGNNTFQSSSTILINASTHAKLYELLGKMYADYPDVNVEEIAMSEAYVYMTTGSLPEGTDESFQIKDLDPIGVNDIVFKPYIVDYDTTYYTDDTQTETETIHSTELMCYTTTSETIEIIVYMQEFDEEAAVKYLREFLGLPD